jgi:hypothetical protein
MFIKIKQFPKLYLFKLKIRILKNFVKTIFYLFLIRTPLKLIKNFIKNFFIHIKLSEKYTNLPFYDKSFKFDDNDWFFEKLPLFLDYFEHNKSKHSSIKKILEIGSYEGRSSIFFLNYFNLDNLTSVDTWEGSSEHEKEILDKMGKIESNFDHNTSFYQTVKKVKSTSDNFFIKNDSLYDLILIDGSHEGSQVSKDLNNAFDCLKKGGFILSDDYDYTYHKLGNNVANSFNNFFIQNKKEIKIIYIYRQILIQKV